MEHAIVVIGYGEPARPDREAVEEYLTRIFYRNMRLGGAPDTDAIAERARSIAVERTPDLCEEYDAIGDSPHNRQLREYARRLAGAVESRGYAAETVPAFQFVEPTIETAISDLRTDEPDTVIVLPAYPLCGPSTTVAAIETVHDTVEAMDGFDPEIVSIAGWHRHPRYHRLRAENCRTFLNDRNLEPDAADTAFIFAAHGTPQSYVEDGSRYITYVEEYCTTQAALLGIESYTLGYQNHDRGDIEWTQPAIEQALESVDATEVIVEPVSFLHEQSETLFDLDIELADHAAALGKSLHRVPIPVEDERIEAVFADLVEPAIAGIDPHQFALNPCSCATTSDTWCLCAPRREC